MKKIANFQLCKNNEVNTEITEVQDGAISVSSFYQGVVISTDEVSISEQPKGLGIIFVKQTPNLLEFL